MLGNVHANSITQSDACGNYSQKTHLEIHQIEKFVDFGRQNFDSLFVDFDPIGLFIRFGLWDGPGATPPRVEHDRMILALLQHLVEGGVNRGLLDVLGNTGEYQI